MSLYDIEGILGRSSLGTPEAKALRESVPDEQARAVVARAEQLREIAELREAVDDARRELAAVEARVAYVIENVGRAMTTTDRPAVSEGKRLAAGRTTAGLTITVHGLPRPKGSMRHIGRGRMVEQVKGGDKWRKAIVKAAQAVQQPQPLTGPLCVEMTVSLPRYTTHYRTGRYALLLRDNAPGWPVSRATGDADKYLRAGLDSLTTAGTWTDDSLVVEATVRKVWVGGGIDALDRPGAVIRIWPLGGAA